MLSMAFASGWMTIRGTRRRQAMDRGFVVSDHVDWPELLWAIQETLCERVLATHGSVAILVRWLREQGLQQMLCRHSLPVKKTLLPVKKTLLCRSLPKTLSQKLIGRMNRVRIKSAPWKQQHVVGAKACLPRAASMAHSKHGTQQA